MPTTLSPTPVTTTTKSPRPPKNGASSHDTKSGAFSARGDSSSTASDASVAYSLVVLAMMSYLPWTSPMPHPSASSSSGCKITGSTSPISTQTSTLVKIASAILLKSVRSFQIVSHQLKPYLKIHWHVLLPTHRLIIFTFRGFRYQSLSCIVLRVFFSQPSTPWLSREGRCVGVPLPTSEPSSCRVPR